MNYDDRAQHAALAARFDALKETVDKVASSQEDIKRELSEIRGARKMAWGILGAVGGVGGIIGYLAHKLNLPVN